MNTAVVTGANGFVGRSLLRELSQNGVTVFAVVRRSGSSTEGIQTLSGVQIISCSMDDLAALPAHISVRPDVFYHLAWSGGTGPARGDSAMQLQNVRWTLDAVNTAAKLGCRRFIGIGSIAELDVCASVETDGLIPNVTSHYGSAKTAAHSMSKAACGQLGLEHIWARLANLYGVGDSSANFINFAAKRMLSGQSAAFTAGEQLYDFTCVSDAAQGLFKLGARGRSNASYFVGSGHPQRLHVFIRMLRDEIDPSIPLHLGAVPFHGVSLPERSFDCGPLIRDAGYCPQVRFKDGIKPVVQWLREELKRKEVLCQRGSREASV